jgi:hypothetical protein
MDREQRSAISGTCLAKLYPALASNPLENRLQSGWRLRVIRTGIMREATGVSEDGDRHEAK